MDILALADDMTGALEVGAKFSAAGISTIVSPVPVPFASEQVIVLDTETRHLDPAEAARKLGEFVTGSLPKESTFIYKKTDSTLRGNIRAELSALARLFPGSTIGYAPAYPAMGRTVRNGILYVHGVAVSETDFARDALNPVLSSAISSVLDPSIDCCVFDGESDWHLAESAQSILLNPRMRIAAGPAGLAEMLAVNMNTSRRLAAPYPHVPSCLVLNGSRHPVSTKQIDRLRGSGWWVVEQQHAPTSRAKEVAMANAAFLLEQARIEDPEALLILGGDTAYAFVGELGFPPLTPIGEIVPGVPVSRIHTKHLTRGLPRRQRDLILITKAGGFGDDDVLIRAHAKLSYGERSTAR